MVRVSRVRPAKKRPCSGVVSSQRLPDHVEDLSLSLTGLELAIILHLKSVERVQGIGFLLLEIIGWSASIPIVSGRLSRPSTLAVWIAKAYCKPHHTPSPRSLPSSGYDTPCGVWRTRNSTIRDAIVPCLSLEVGSVDVK
jgi:hypothetical protein